MTDPTNAISLEGSTLRFNRRLEVSKDFEQEHAGTTVSLASGSMIEQGVRLMMAGGCLRLAEGARVGEGSMLLLQDTVELAEGAAVGESVQLEAEGAAVKIGAGTRLGRFSRLWAHNGPIDVGARCAIGQFNTWIGTGHGIAVAEGCDFTHQVTLDSAGGSIEMGAGSGVGPGSVLYGHGGLRLGTRCAIAGLTMIVPGNHRFDRLDRPIREQGVEGRPITIGDDVWIGGGVVVLGGATIGDGAVVGAGAVVRGTIAARSIVVGVPAKSIGIRGDRDAVGEAPGP